MLCSLAGRNTVQYLNMKSVSLFDLTLQEKTIIVVRRVHKQFL